MSERKSLTELAALCRIAAMDVPVGSFWRHYGGDIYEVVGFGVQESTGEVEVEYRPAPKLEDDRYDGLKMQRFGEPDLTGLNFHRPFAEWDQKVPLPAVPGAPQVSIARFTRVRRREIWS
jgi:hypothetical protein